MTDEQFLALPRAEAMRHILRQKTDAEIVRLRKLWDGAHPPTTQPVVSGEPSPVDAPVSLLEGAWNVVGALNLLGALVISALLFSSERTLGAGIGVLICAPFAALAPFSVAVVMGRARRIEDHLARIASISRSGG